MIMPRTYGTAFGFQSIAESFAVGDPRNGKGGNRLRHGSASLEGEAIDIWAAGTDGFQTDLVFALLRLVSVFKSFQLVQSPVSLKAAIFE